MEPPSAAILFRIPVVFRFVNRKKDKPCASVMALAALWTFLLAPELIAKDAPEVISDAETGVILLQTGVILLGLLFSALFSGSEVAFFSQENATRFNNKEQKLDATERRIKLMLDSPRRLLATILIGNTFANIITAVFAAVVTSKLVATIGLPKAVVFTLEVVVITFAIVTLTEITPKVLAIKDTYAISRRLSGLLYTFFVLLRPFAVAIASSTAKIESGIPQGQEHITSDDIKTIAEMGERQGTLREDEREIIENVIDFGSTTVKEIMTSRVNIIAIASDATLEDVLTLIRQKSTSRFPLYENDLDNITGIIHAKDILPYLLQEQENPAINWQTNARRALFIPVSKKIDDLLKDFQREKTHLAIVVDEYGGTEGLITLDDVLEEIIGEFHDEQGAGEQAFTMTPEGDYIFDAKIDLDDVADVLDRQLTTEKDEFETLGGLIFHLAERIPDKGDKVYFKDLELTVLEIEHNRLDKIRIHLMAADASKHSDGPDADTDSGSSEDVPPDRG
ncbi:MAG: hemolysin family protein [Cyclonatronaceae bacterium]